MLRLVIWSLRSTGRVFDRPIAVESCYMFATEQGTVNSDALVPSRGDKTAIELFLAGVGGWEQGLRQILIRDLNGDRANR